MSKKVTYSAFLSSAEDCRNLIGHFPRLVMLIDLKGTIVYWNNAGEELFGYTTEEIVGEPVWTLYTNRDRSDFIEDLNALKKGEILSVELEGRRNDGSLIWVDVKRKLITLESGRTLILGSASDISTLVKAEYDLARSEARAQAVLETAIEGIITIDKKGNIESFNQSAEKIFGYSENEVLGNNVKMLMPSPYKEEHDHYMHHYLETGERQIIGIGREVRGKRKDGEVFPMDLSVSEVRLEGETIFTGVVRDISGRRRLENQILEIAEEERRRIGRELHDGLGQMLTGIGLISRNLAKRLKSNGLPGADEVEEISDMIREADEQARDLAHGLVNLELENEGLYTAVDQLCKRVEKLFKIECRNELDSNIQIKNERAMLHLYRIAQEAISNAVKHGKASEVKVYLQRAGDYLQLKVEDNGSGFKNSTTGEKQHGIGLNSMSYRANLLGGHLNMRKSETGYTVVDCKIPVHELTDV